MKPDNLDTLFKSLQDDFDFEVPNASHEDRFLAKLKSQSKTVTLEKKHYPFLKPLLAVAASIVLLIVLTFTFNQQDTTKDLASVSPEMAETQSFFTATIAQELKTLQNENAPEVQPLIQDALKQLKILEDDYEKLKLDLTKSGEDKRVIYAMITNFQNRISILEEVLKTIDTVKQLKNTSHENKIII